MAKKFESPWHDSVCFPQSQDKEVLSEDYNVVSYKFGQSGVLDINAN